MVALVWPVVTLYGCEYWTLRKNEARLDPFEMKRLLCLFSILVISCGRKLIFGTGGVRCRSLPRLPRGLARYCSTPVIGPSLPAGSNNRIKNKT